MFEPDDFEWDETKATSNFYKHGFGFHEAACIFEDPGRREWHVTRDQDYESRSKAVGLLRGQLFTVVFTQRGDTCRIISARRANAKRSANMGIVRYKRGEVPLKMTAEEWARLDAMTPEQIEQNALDDPDNPPSTDEELERGVLARNIRLLRQSTGMSQEKFAAKFHIHVARLRDWEQGRHMPDSAMRAYLRVIQENQKAVEDTLARVPSFMS